MFIRLCHFPCLLIFVASIGSTIKADAYTSIDSHISKSELKLCFFYDAQSPFVPMRAEAAPLEYLKRTTYSPYLHDYESSKLQTAIANAPSLVLWPPMNPLACTKTAPSGIFGLPVRSASAARTESSSSSRTPRQASGSGLRDSKLPSETGTHCTRHLEPSVALSG